MLYKQRCHQYCWGQQRVPPSWLVKYIGHCLLLSNQFFVLLYLFTFLLVSRTQLDCAHMQTSGQFKFAFIYNKWLALILMYEVNVSLLSHMENYHTWQINCYKVYLARKNPISYDIPGPSILSGISRYHNQENQKLCTGTNQTSKMK